MENIKGTVFDFALVLRQMYTEAILREKLQAVGGVYYPSTECISFDIDEVAPHGAYGVTTKFANTKTHEAMTIRR
jgi:phenol 2-monooxygenase